MLLSGWVESAAETPSGLTKQPHSDGDRSLAPAANDEERKSPRSPGGAPSISVR
jgi:hypothetical protein